MRNIGRGAANGEAAEKTMLVYSAAAEPCPQRKRILSNVLFIETVRGGFACPSSGLVKSGSSQIVSAVGLPAAYTLLTTMVCHSLNTIGVTGFKSSSPASFASQLQFIESQSSPVSSRSV